MAHEDGKLPKPADFAKKLREQSLQMFKQWHASFAVQYKQLSLAFNLLQKKFKVINAAISALAMSPCIQVDFEGLEARSRIEAEREKAQQQRREAQLTDKFQKSKQLYERMSHVKMSMSKLYRDHV